MTETYSASLRTLHWLMAAFIFAAIGLGVWSLYLPRGDALRMALLNLHKSCGITVLALVVLRVGARLASGSPAYRPPIGRLNHLAASTAHGLIYVLMFAMPISGYVHSMAGGHGFHWFGLFAVPNVVPPSKPLDEGAGGAHYLFAWAIGALLTVHVLAALWHRFLRHDGVLARMAPALERRAA